MGLLIDNLGTSLFVVQVFLVFGRYLVKDTDFLCELGWFIIETLM